MRDSDAEIGTRNLGRGRPVVRWTDGVRETLDE